MLPKLSPVNILLPQNVNFNLFEHQFDFQLRLELDQRNAVSAMYNNTSATKCWNKKLPNIFKRYSKSSYSCFTVRLSYFKLEQKVVKYLGCFFNKIWHEDKVQFGHTEQYPYFLSSHQLTEIGGSAQSLFALNKK